MYVRRTPDDIVLGRKVVRFWRDPTSDDVRWDVSGSDWSPSSALTTPFVELSCIFWYATVPFPLVCPWAHRYPTPVYAAEGIDGRHRKGDFVFTSVDCLRLIQLLLGREITAEEKSRMRRHLEVYADHLSRIASRPRTTKYCVARTVGS